MKTAILLVMLCTLPLKSLAQQHNSTSAHRMVVGGSALAALTLEGLIRANSFVFPIDSRLPTGLPLTERIQARRFGSLALRYAQSITIEARLRDVYSAVRFAHFEIQEQAIAMLVRSNQTSDPALKARLKAQSSALRLRANALLDLSSAEQEARFGRGLPRTVTYSLPAADIDRLDRMYHRIALDCSAEIKNVRVLTVLHNQRILTAMRYARHGTIALAVIAGAGLLAAEESASALTGARRNLELARMMRDQK